MGIFKFRRSSKATGDPAELAALNALERKAHSSWEAGTSEEVSGIQGSIITAATAIGPAGDAFRCRALSGRSAVLSLRGDYLAAEVALNSATDIIVARSWQNSNLHLNVMTNTAVLRWHQGERTAALKVLEHAHSVGIARAVSPADSPVIANLLQNLVGYHIENCSPTDSARWFLIAREYCLRYGESFPGTWGRILRLTIPARAFPDARAALAVLKADAATFAERVPTDHPATSAVLAHLGTALLNAGDREAAAAAFSKAIARPQVNRLAGYEISNGQGLLSLRSGKYAEAEQHFRAALQDADEPSLGKLARPLALNNTAVALREQGRADESLPLFIEAISLFELALGPNHYQPANALRNQAQALRMLGRKVEAIACCEQALLRFGVSAPSSGPVAEKAAETRELLEQLHCG